MEIKNSKLKTLWESLAGIFGLIAGLTPHVLHHIGLIAGVAFLTSTAGTIFFGLIGLLATIPLLLRLHRKFNTFAAPAIALVIFTAMFLLSAYVIGPSIIGEDSQSPAKQSDSQHDDTHH